MPTEQYKLPSPLSKKIQHCLKLMNSSALYLFYLAEPDNLTRAKFQFTRLYILVREKMQNIKIVVWQKLEVELSSTFNNAYLLRYDFKHKNKNGMEIG
jgi:hypothetical protein